MTIHSISRENAEHYVWGEICDGWHLVKDAKLSVIEEQMVPNQTMWGQPPLRLRSGQAPGCPAGQSRATLSRYTVVTAASAGTLPPPAAPRAAGSPVPPQTACPETLPSAA